MQASWTDKDRALLDAILDQIIPANPGRSLPAAGALGIADFLAAQAGRDADLSAQFRAALGCVAAHSGNVTAATVRQLEADRPEAFNALLRHTYMGYYSRPDIRSLQGLSDLPTQPRGYDVPPEPSEFMADLVAPVKHRGPCYRVCR